MRYMDIGCNIKCCECREKCGLKDLMEESIVNPYLEQYFYSTIIADLKPQAGLLISQGKNPIEVQNDLTTLAVSFYVARLQLIEQLHKK